MSDAKKRSGIGQFWDAVAPPAEAAPTPESSSSPAEPTEAARPTSRAARAVPAEAPPKPRGRHGTGIPKERMTVNLSAQSLRVLEELRYLARKNGRRSATFSDLIDEAVALLAKQYKLKIEDV